MVSAQLSIPTGFVAQKIGTFLALRDHDQRAPEIICFPLLLIAGQKDQGEKEARQREWQEQEGKRCRGEQHIGSEARFCVAKCVGGSRPLPPLRLRGR